MKGRGLAKRDYKSLSNVVIRASRTRVCMREAKRCFCDDVSTPFRAGSIYVSTLKLSILSSATTNENMPMGQSGLSMKFGACKQQAHFLVV